MLVDSKNIIDLAAFTINKGISIKEYDLGCTKVYTVDNFYEDFERAYTEMLKIPFAPVLETDNVTHFDGRSSYCQSMRKTECPLTEDYRYLVAQLADVDPENVSVPDRILFNAFKFDAEWFDYDKFWYNVHTDLAFRDHSNLISMVLYMNRHYERGEGLNIFDSVVRDTKFNIPFESREKYEPIFTLQAEPNTAILFNGHMPHSPRITTDQFSKEIRYSQVSFAWIDE